MELRLLLKSQSMVYGSLHWKEHYLNFKAYLYYHTDSRTPFLRRRDAHIRTHTHMHTNGGLAASSICFREKRKVAYAVEGEENIDFVCIPKDGAIDQGWILEGGWSDYSWIKEICKRIDQELFAYTIKYLK